MHWKKKLWPRIKSGEEVKKDFIKKATRDYCTSVYSSGRADQTKMGEKN